MASKGKRHVHVKSGTHVHIKKSKKGKSVIANELVLLEKGKGKGRNKTSVLDSLSYEEYLSIFLNYCKNKPITINRGGTHGNK